MQSGKNYTVILADDDFDDAELFQSVLSEVAPQIKFIHVEDGRDLLRLAETVLPDAVFLDINMPRVDGWQCLKQLRESVAGERIPIFMYSTSSHARDQQLSRDLGASGFITKPSEIRVLQQVLTDITRKMMEGGSAAV